LAEAGEQPDVTLPSQLEGRVEVRKVRLN